jgi:uncharacterized protein
MALVVAVLLLASACGGSGDGGSEPRTSDGSSYERATALIDTGDDSVILDVEVADSDEERQRGLMFREELPKDEGMAFIFFEPSAGGFWMKNTLIPLSIAFFDRDGTIVAILDMSPCKKEPCPVYEPGVPYWGALEVNRGAFDRWGVEEGDVIRIT